MQRKPETFIVSAGIAAALQETLISDTRRARQAISGAINTNFALQFGVSSVTVVWTAEDLKAAGIPEQHIPYTLRVLKTERRHPSPYIPWQGKEQITQEIAIWLLSPKTFPANVKMDIDEQWWAEMVMWAFGVDVRQAAMEYEEALEAFIERRRIWEEKHRQGSGN